MVDNLSQRRRAVEIELRNLQRQVETTDAKLRAFLADRENKPHPRHLELVEKIQTYRIEPSIATKQLETILDNLQWKVYYLSRSWRQLWENAEARRRTSTPGSTSDNTSSKETNQKGVYSVDRLWSIQTEKLGKLGEQTSESKTDFVKRIKKKYGELASEKRGNEEIVMKFNKDEKRCTLELKKSESDHA